MWYNYINMEFSNIEWKWSYDKFFRAMEILVQPTLYTEKTPKKAISMG